MRRLSLVILAAFAVSVIALGILQYEKFFVLSLIRVQDALSSRQRADAGPAASPDPAAITIDFAGATKPENYFFEQTSTASHTFEKMEPATLHIAGLKDTTMTLKPLGTRILYVNGEMEQLKMFTTGDGTAYADAVVSLVATARQLGILPELDVEGYALHLDQVPDQEVWVPRLRLGEYEASARLNCEWSGTVPARDEIHSTRCRPYLSIERRFASTGHD